MDRDGGGSREEANGGDGPTRRKREKNEPGEQERGREGEKETGVAEKRIERRERARDRERERGREDERERPGEARVPQTRREGEGEKRRNAWDRLRRRKNPHARFYNENVSADATETNATIIERTKRRIERHEGDPGPKRP